MSLQVSTRLGPYEIVAPLGAGGMGEVYRAKDSRLERDVAVKVLPDGLAADERFRSRFEREAKSISALNHPHICTVHDVGKERVNGREVQYLVLELLEGESLADRLLKGPLALEQVFRHGIEIAAALEAAHRHGLVHRDLKPGNVMLTKSGAKLLDFGLAKPADRHGTGADSVLPTRDRPLTEQGSIVGTFQYMAPEQLEGEEADARTDIFALGAVLHEMATGQKAFEGKTRTSLIAAIVSSQPPAISSVQAMCPPALDHVVRKCLEKDPDDRWQNARDVMSELQWIQQGGSKVGLPAPISMRRRSRERLAWVLAATASLAAIAFGIGYVRRTPQPSPMVRFTIPPPVEVVTVGSPRISPDGRIVAFDATDGTGKAQVWLRSLDSLEARALPGTEGASRPFWSPDGRYVAFAAGGKLKKIDVSGGPPQTLADVPTGSDGSWSPDGVILLDGRGNDPILRIPAAGGVPKPEVAPDPAKNLVSVGWPEFLPDGKHFLYVSGPTRPEDSQLVVRNLESKVEKVLLKTASRVQYAPPGFLVYVREQTLMAQPFDVKALEMRGEPFPLAENLGIDAVGLAHFSASQTGVLVHRAGEASNRQLVWVDRNGKELGTVGEPARYASTWSAPDGKRVVIEVADVRSARSDLWIRDLARGVSSRFTFDPKDDSDPLWSPDGRSIVFSSNRADAVNLYVKDASGTSEEELLFESQEEKYASDLSRDGAHLLFYSRGNETGWDVWALPMKGERKPFPVVRTRFVELFATFSPDGRYVAYQSNESGRSEIYVQEFPQARSKWQVSTEGGSEPYWRADGRELYYRSPDARIMAVPVEGGATFTAGTPNALFRARIASITTRAHYRPTPDGQRFLILAPEGRATIVPTTVVLNWAPAAKD
jgi:eukaryotic-like serine/threonine-protein kinase